MESRIDHAAKKWELSHFEEIYRHPTKAVFSAQSRQFGPVILKIDRNIGQLKSEHHMLAGLSGAYNCKVYAYRLIGPGDSAAQGSVPGEADSDIFQGI